jgi:SHS2 domain-containing protein
MRVTVDSKGYQALFSISQEPKILNQVKLPGAEIKLTASDPSGPIPSHNTLQAVNNTILRFMQTIGMVNEKVSGYELSNQNTDLEEAIAALVESMNKVLSVIKETSMEIINDSEIVQGSLWKLQEIIISAVKIPEALSEEVSMDLSSIGIKLMHDGWSLSLDHKVLKEAISSNNGETTRTIKAVTANLFEALPLCVDPNSGNLIYTGRKLEDGDDRASKAIAALNEELEKERTELVNKLDMAELLISHSTQFIANLKFSSEMAPSEEHGI